MCYTKIGRKNKDKDMICLYEIHFGKEMKEIHSGKEMKKKKLKKM